jgi:exosortase/archaeosortase family protein
VGIDEACSGIRSFQATLMIALFLGEIYRLILRRRFGLVLGGFIMAFIFNVGRTLLLVSVASHKGIAAVSSWHDPAGVTILLFDFLCLWLIARKMGDRRGEIGKTEAPMSEAGSIHTSRVSLPSLPSSIFHLPSSTYWLLALWLFVAEVGTEAWYRAHESHLPKNLAWRVELPSENPTYRPVLFSEKTKQFLRYDEGVNGAWLEKGAVRCQAIFLRWNPGRIAPNLAKSHTPEVCLTAAGRELISQSDLRLIPVRSLQMPFRSYVMKDETGPIHVFYCLWEDRADTQDFKTASLTFANRLRPVMAGRRNSGQRSLEVAIW